MENAIKSYLEMQCNKDAALAEKYDATKLKACVNYINTQAREYLSKESGYVADEVVYKWARDFYLECASERKQEKKQEIKPVNIEKPKKLIQLELF